MTPKEKAKELVDKFTVVGLQQRNEGYQCALIAVDEILKVVSFYNDSQAEVIYFKEVKTEIEKL
jgi:hypothetical protein